MRPLLSNRALAVFAPLAGLVLLSLGASATTRPTFANAVSSSPSTKIADAAISTMFVPSADSYVDSSLPNVNYGSATQLRVDGSPIVKGFLRFSVSGSAGTITNATLRVYANSSLSTGVSANRVADNTWGESTITYLNAPAAGTAIGTSAAVTAGTWVSINVTPYVTGNGTFSFALTSANVTALSLASREATNKPQLVVTTAATIATGTPSSGATKTATPKPTAAVTSTPTSAAVLVGAGDIAVCGNTGAQQTAKLIDGIPGTVATFGDNSNDEGTAAQYANCYDPDWGRFKARTRPAIGNHDYLTSSGTPYFNYFGAASHPTKAYYSYGVGSWHVVVLNSECSHVGGCQAGSAQEQWLKADLAANQKRCTLAYWHEPRFSSGQWGNHTRYDAFWQDLYQAHATLVLNGHDHDYERFAPQNPSGKADPNGLREFVVGTGGAGTGPLNSIQPNSEVRHTGTLGVIKLTLLATSYSWKFVPVAGQTFTDSGSESCN